MFRLREALRTALGQPRRTAEQGQVAQTIWRQISMSTKMACGARQPVGGGNKLHFNVTIHPNQTHKIEVTYEVGLDLYTVKLWKIPRMKSPFVVEQETMVYADQLSDVIYRMCNK